jgi:hypothetical protein
MGNIKAPLLLRFNLVFLLAGEERKPQFSMELVWGLSIKTPEETIISLELVILDQDHLNSVFQNPNSSQEHLQMLMIIMMK